MNILIVHSSATGGASVSRALIDGFVAKLEERAPGLAVTIRDLDADPIPHLTSATVGGIGAAEPVDEAQHASRALSDRLIAELRAADLIVIGAPMYNFGIPSTLKAWFDHALRAGVTFRYTANGPVGLLTGKRAVVIETRGGIYSEGPAVAMDAQEPHLRTLLGFIGIDDVAFVRAEGLTMGEDPRARGVTAARSLLADLLPPLARAA